MYLNTTSSHGRGMQHQHYTREDNGRGAKDEQHTIDHCLRIVHLGMNLRFGKELLEIVHYLSSL